MRRLEHGPRGPSPVHLAGWLFADLLLVLFVAVISTMPANSESSSALASPTGSPSMTLPSSKPAEPSLPVLDLAGEQLELNVDVPAMLRGEIDGPAATQVLNQMNTALAAHGWQHRRAGFVLSFGVAPSADYGDGLAARVASQVNVILSRRLTAFQGIQSRAYWDYGQVGKVRMEIFFFR